MVGTAFRTWHEAKRNWTPRDQKQKTANIFLKFFLFPTLTCGFFVFSSVSPPSFLPPAPPPPPPPSAHTLTHTHSTHITHRRGTMCTATGPDVRHGVRRCPAGVPWSPVAFAWQAWDNVHCQGSLWRSSGVPWSPARLYAMCLPRGRMYAPVSLWCRSGVPWFPLLCRWLLRGRPETMCTGKGSDVRPGVPLASLQCPLVSAALPVAFGWQACNNAHCQGLGCTPRCPSGILWRRSGVPWFPPLCRWLLRGRRETMCTGKGSDVRPGVPLASLQCPLVSAALPVALRGRRGAMCTVGNLQPGKPRDAHHRLFVTVYVGNL